MNSGIYKLTFKSGKYYIGKSNNIDRRWKEHHDKFNRGKAATRMQQEFNKYGMPKGEVLLYCHEDHIDIMEALYIHSNWGPNILNGTHPTTVSQSDYNALVKHPELLNYSTASHCLTIYNNAIEIRDLKKELENTNREYKRKVAGIVSGTALQESEDLVSELESEVLDLKRELRKLKSRNWFERLFNL
jgi:predicted GIY-YIG superfamily endonuclease